MDILILNKIDVLERNIEELKSLVKATKGVRIYIFYLVIIKYFQGIKKTWFIKEH